MTRGAGPMWIGHVAEKEHLMFSKTTHNALLPALLVLAGVLATARPAQAGPPLICHRFDIGTAASLPWGDGDGWDTRASSYDTNRLTPDVLRLLTPETPVLVRMETLRRATIYAARDKEASAALLAALLGRAVDAAGSQKSSGLALFDAGYLVETYRQASFIARWDMLSRKAASEWEMKAEPGGLDGYAWVARALNQTGPNPEMEFAASLMRQGEGSREHMRRASAAAPQGSLLARALADFNYR